MESKILAGVLQSDTHTRLQAGEQLLEYLRDEENQLGEFEDLEELIKGLANWMSSSNFRVSGRTCMCIVCVHRVVCSVHIVVLINAHTFYGVFYLMPTLVVGIFVSYLMPTKSFLSLYYVLFNAHLKWLFYLMPVHKETVFTDPSV